MEQRLQGKDISSDDLKRAIQTTLQRQKAGYGEIYIPGLQDPVLCAEITAITCRRDGDDGFAMSISLRGGDERIIVTSPDVETIVCLTNLAISGLMVAIAPWLHEEVSQTQH